jgi:hypothetical protein
LLISLQNSTKPLKTVGQTPLTKKKDEFEWLDLFEEKTKPKPKTFKITGNHRKAH